MNPMCGKKTLESGNQGSNSNDRIILAPSDAAALPARIRATQPDFELKSRSDLNVCDRSFN